MCTHKLNLTDGMGFFIYMFLFNPGKQRPGNDGSGDGGNRSDNSSVRSSASSSRRSSTTNSPCHSPGE